MAVSLPERSAFAVYFMFLVGKEEYPLSIRAIAKCWSVLSPGYLEEIVGKLRRAGLVTGSRGKGGGYTLAKKPSSITIADIIYAVEGQPRLAPVLDRALEGATPQEGWCAVRRLWLQFDHDIGKLFSARTLSDLLADHKTFEQ